MKKSFQLLALIAFLGSWAVLALAAGGKNHHHTETCEQEWKEAYTPPIAKDQKASLTANK